MNLSQLSTSSAVEGQSKTELQHHTFGAFCLAFHLNFLPTNEFSIKLLKVKLLAGEQKATEIPSPFMSIRHRQLLKGAGHEARLPHCHRHITGSESWL